MKLRLYQTHMKLLCYLFTVSFFYHYSEPDHNSQMKHFYAKQAAANKRNIIFSSVAVGNWTSNIQHYRPVCYPAELFHLPSCVKFSKLLQTPQDCNTKIKGERIWQNKISLDQDLNYSTQRHHITVLPTLPWSCL
jgi:hypothetical protein